MFGGIFMASIGLIVSDAEGCVIPGRGRHWDLDVLAVLARYNQRVRREGGARLTLSSGRPLQYVEALGHAIALSAPACCENGAVLFFPEEGRREQLSTPLQRMMMEKVRDFLGEAFAERARVAAGKEACVSLIPRDSSTDAVPVPAGVGKYERAGLIPREPGEGVEDLWLQASASLREHLNLGEEELNFTYSAGAVDITPKGIDKGTGLNALAERLGLGRDEILGIGDSHNDIPMTERVGRFAVPANAIPDLRERADYVSPHSHGRGVVDILRHYGLLSAE